MRAGMHSMPFKDVIGHRRVIELLARSIRRDSLPPSLIFAGPAGVGKRRTALATAQLVNCTAPIISEPTAGDTSGKSLGKALPEARSLAPEAGSHLRPRQMFVGDGGVEFDACGKCAACTRIARGVHGDVLIVEPGDNESIRIEQVRDVIDRAACGRSRAAAASRSSMRRTLVIVGAERAAQDARGRVASMFLVASR